METTAPVITYAIIALTVIATIAGFSNEELFEKNIFSIKSVIQDKDIYRIITSQFFHVNWAHLLFNMFSFYSFSTSMEENYGPFIVAAIYMASGVIGDLLALVIKRKDMRYSAVGASGAVCGIIFASIFFIPGGSIFIFPLPVPIPSWLFAVLFMGISLFGIGREASIIGHEAHIGGALAGIAAAVIYNPAIIYSQYILLLALTIPTVALLIYFIVKKE